MIQNSEKTERRRQFFKSFEAKSLRSRSLLTQLSDDLTAICGSTTFLIFHIFFFTFWILANTGHIPQIEPFDPYPFGFLTLVVSLEAIFLAIFILVSQNRQSYVTSLREEVHLQVDLIAEEEITKVLEVLSEIRQKVGIKEDDPELNKMLQRTDTNYIERIVITQLENANKPIFRQLLNEFPDIIKAPVTKPIEIVQNLKENGSSDTSEKSKG